MVAVQVLNSIFFDRRRGTAARHVGKGKILPANIAAVVEPIFYPIPTILVSRTYRSKIIWNFGGRRYESDHVTDKSHAD